MIETKPDCRCLVEELYNPQILPEGWVLLRRTPNTAPADGFIEIKMLGVDADPLAKSASLDECLDAIVYHRKGSRAASPRVASSWFLNILKRHGRVKPVEGEDLSKFRRPDG